ncbi:hypothetical protein [Aeromicrobium sp.]|uniref:hypothetical protein n=1 Tax=Aeromicrobium sp. TaxID=1871063 RepID=UPI0030BBE685
MRITSRRSRLLQGCLFVILASLVGSACNAKTTETNTGAKEPPAQAQWKQYAEIADRPAVKLNWRDRPSPPKGFTEAEMDTFAKLEVGLIEKSISTKVASMGPGDAVDYVTDDLLTTTKDTYVREAAGVLEGENAWQWFLASLFDGARVEPAKIVRVDWDATRLIAELDDGTPAPVLKLTLQVFVVHTFGPKAHPRNIVVRRAVALRGFRPNGGPAWWPVLSTFTEPFGNDGCALKESVLRPLRAAKYVKKDLGALKKAWAAEGVAPIGETTKLDAKAAREYEAFCAAHPNGA